MSLSPNGIEVGESAPPKALACPNCGMATEKVIECPRCHTEGCVEFCIPAGVGTICAQCESEED